MNNLLKVQQTSESRESKQIDKYGLNEEEKMNLLKMLAKKVYLLEELAEIENQDQDSDDIDVAKETNRNLKNQKRNYFINPKDSDKMRPGWVMSYGKK